MASKEYRFASCGESINVWIPSELTKPQQSIPVQMHTGKPCTSIRWNRSGSFLTYAAGEVKLVQTSNFSTHTIANTSDAECVAFVGSSRRIASGHRDTTIKLWNVKTRALARTLTGHMSAIKCLDVQSTTYVVSGSTSGDVIAHGVETGDASTIMRTPSVQPITDIKCSPHHPHRVVTSAFDGTVNVWDAQKCQLVKSFERRPSSRATEATAAMGVSFSPINEKLFASCGADGQIHFYDAVDMRKVMTLAVQDKLLCLLIFPDGHTVISGTESGHLHQFDLRSSATVGSLTRVKGHQTAVRSLSCDYSGSGEKRRSANLSTFSTSPPSTDPEKKTVSHQKTPESHILSSGSGVISPLDKPALKSQATAGAQAGTFLSPVGTFEPAATSSTSKSSRADQSSLRLLQTDPGRRSQHIDQPKVEARSSKVQTSTRASTQSRTTASSQAAIFKTTTTTTTTTTTSPKDFSSSSHPSSATRTSDNVTSPSSTANVVSPGSRPFSLTSQLQNNVAVKPRDASSSPAAKATAGTASSSLFSPLGQASPRKTANEETFKGLAANLGTREKGTRSATTIQSTAPLPVATAETSNPFSLSPSQRRPAATAVPSTSASERIAQNAVFSRVSSLQSSSSVVATAATGTSVTTSTSTAAAAAAAAPAAPSAPAAAVASSPDIPAASTDSGPPLKFIQNMIDDSIEEMRLAIHRDIRNLHTDLVRQFERIEEKIAGMGNEGRLAEENRQLREENERLKKRLN